jgi:RNA polymerase sigma factor (sigma-70 family)
MRDMPAQQQISEGPATPHPTAGTRVPTETPNGKSLSTRLVLSPRGQFDRYMADIKRTALLSPEKLVSIARAAYVHRHNIQKTLSKFPPCLQALAERFEHHKENNFKLTNFVTAYGDQSVEARDHLYELNRKSGRDEACNMLNIKKSPENQERLQKTLENFSQYCVLLRDPDPEARRSSFSWILSKLSDTYMYMAFRYEEIERHRQIFEEITSQCQDFADLLFSLVDPEDYDSLVDSFTTNDIEPITKLIPERDQVRFRTDALRMQRILDTVGLSIRDIIRLRTTYFHHVSEQQRLVNDIVQANLLLSAREAIRFRPKDDRLFDTCQEANEGLIIAAYRFDYWRGFAFSTFACWWIKQRLLRDRDHSINGVFPIPCSIATRAAKIHKARAEIGHDPENAPSSSVLASKVNCTVSQVDEAIQAYSPVVNSDEVFAVLETKHPDTSQVAELEDLQSVVRMALDTLPEKKRDVCKMRWGIGYPQRMTLSEVSKLHGITKERARNIEQEGLKFLREGEFAQQLAELHRLP